MSDRASGADGLNSAENLDEIFRLLAAHALHVKTQLPRGQIGAQAAEQFLAAIPGAVQLRLADVTGTAAAIVETFVAHGLLPVLPDPKVSRAIPRLLAPLTPLVEARSARLWTLWLTALHDPRSPLVAKLRKATPAAAFAVRSPAPTARVQTQRALVAERDALAARVVALQAEQVELAAQSAARAEENVRAAAERDALAAQVAVLQAERAELRGQFAALQAEQVELAAQFAARVEENARAAAERDGLLVQVSVLQAERAELRGRLAALEDAHRQAAAERDDLAAQCAPLKAEHARLLSAAQAGGNGQTTARIATERETRSLSTPNEHARLLADAEAAASAELARVAEFYEQQIREAEARIAELEHHTLAATELADLQALLRESVRGQEQLTLFALRKNSRQTKPRA